MYKLITKLTYNIFLKPISPHSGWTCEIGRKHDVCNSIIRLIHLYIRSDDACHDGNVFKWLSHYFSFLVNKINLYVNPKIPKNIKLKTFKTEKWVEILLCATIFLGFTHPIRIYVPKSNLTQMLWSLPCRSWRIKSLNDFNF